MISLRDPLEFSIPSVYDPDIEFLPDLDLDLYPDLDLERDLLLDDLDPNSSSSL